MRHIVTHFFDFAKVDRESDTLDHPGPAELIRLSAVLDATELVVKLQAPRTGFAIAKLVRLAILGIVDT